jgi:hypothetical protein
MRCGALIGLAGRSAVTMWPTTSANATTDITIGT